MTLYEKELAKGLIVVKEYLGKKAIINVRGEKFEGTIYDVRLDKNDNPEIIFIECDLDDDLRESADFEILEDKLDGPIVKHYDSTIIEEESEWNGYTVVRSRSYFIDATTEHDLDLMYKWFKDNYYAVDIMVEDYSDKYVGYIEVNLDNMDSSMRIAKMNFNDDYKQMKKELR